MNSHKYVCVVELFAIILCAFRPSYGLQESNFYAGVLCDLHPRIKKRCSRPEHGVKIQQACVFGCSKDRECVGASIDNKHTCFHHFECPDVSGCWAKERVHKYLSKNCAHGGVWNPTKLSCTCANGWVGDRCLDIPSKCMDLIKHGGGYPRGDHRSYLNLASRVASYGVGYTPIIPVVCFIDPSKPYANVYVFTNYGRGNFANRTWDEYRNGFYVDIFNFWIGLENWHVLSMAKFMHYVVCIDSGKRFWGYSNFLVTDERKGYSYTFSGSVQHYREQSEFVNNTFPNCFGPAQNYSFSTKDNDKDGVPSQNCADQVGGGWWFPGSCSSECNLLGVYPEDWYIYPEEQWVRLEGTGPQDIEKAGHVISYLDEPIG